IYLARGIMSNAGVLHPDVSSLPASSSNAHSDWAVYSDAEFEAALSSGKPVIVDFYADWCAACKELEKFTFSDPSVRAKLKEFALFRADLTVETRENAGLKDKFKIMGLPTLQIFNNGKLQKDLTLTGFESKSDFLNRLNKAL